MNAHRKDLADNKRQKRDDVSLKKPIDFRSADGFAPGALISVDLSEQWLPQTAGTTARSLHTLGCRLKDACTGRIGTPRRGLDLSSAGLATPSTLIFIHGFAAEVGQLRLRQQCFGNYLSRH